MKSIFSVVSFQLKVISYSRSHNATTDIKDSKITVSLLEERITSSIPVLNKMILSSLTCFEQTSHHVELIIGFFSCTGHFLERVKFQSSNTDFFKPLVGFDNAI